MGIGDEAATVGRDFALIGAIISTIVGIIIILLGIYGLNKTGLAFIFILIGIVIIIGGWLWYYITRKSKLAAQLETGQVVLRALHL